MRPLGSKKYFHTVSGHQNCAICHPEPKHRKAKEREQGRREIRAQLEGLSESNSFGASFRSKLWRKGSSPSGG